MSEENLVDQIGGQERLNDLISQFYERVIADPVLAPFFAETPMDKLLSMQREFFAVALGAPTTYSGMKLYNAHKDRGITREHLSRYTEHLLQTLKDAGIEEQQGNLVVPRIAVHSPEVLGESGGVDG